MNAVPPGAVLENARQHAGLTPSVLWLRCQGIGGHLTPADLQSVLDGSIAPSATDYDVIAQALNDTFTERGVHHPVPYAEDIGLAGNAR